MRSKYMLLIALLIFSAGIVGCDMVKSDAENVQGAIDSITVYKASLKSRLKSIDAAFPDSDNNPEATLGKIKLTTNEFVAYSDNLKRIDTTDLPADFKMKFDNYSKAVATFSNMLNNSFNGDPDVAQFLYLLSHIQSNIDEIDAAEEALFDLAKDKYDADVPAGASGL